MKSQSVSFTIGNVRVSLSIGDANNNGVVDVSLAVRLVGVFDLSFPPVIVDLDAKLAVQAVDAFKSLADIFKPRKP